MVCMFFGVGTFFVCRGWGHAPSISCQEAFNRGDFEAAYRSLQQNPKQVTPQLLHTLELVHSFYERSYGNAGERVLIFLHHVGEGIMWVPFLVLPIISFLIRGSPLEKMGWKEGSGFIAAILFGVACVYQDLFCKEMVLSTLGSIARERKKIERLRKFCYEILTKPYLYRGKGL